MKEYQVFLKQAAKRKRDMQKLAKTKTLREIAAQYGVSIQRAHQIIGKRQPAG